MKKKKKKRIIFKALFLCFTVYVLISIITIQLELREKRKEYAELQGQIESGQQSVDHLQQQLDSEMDEETVTSIARERLDYAYPDERVFVSTSGD